MKRSVLCLKILASVMTMCFLEIPSKAVAQTSDSVLNVLLSVKESEWIGKPLDSLINVLPPGYIETKVVGLRGTARKLVFLYPNRVWIELHVREFVFINPYSRSQSWDIALFRKEKLYRTVIYKKQDCFRNCDVK